MNALFHITDSPLPVADIGSPQGDLLRLRDIHHKVAEMLALGFQVVDVSRVTGLSTVRISNLRNSPAFVELLSFYRDRREAKAVETQDKLNLLTSAAISELQVRLEEKPEDISNKDLLKLASFGADRTGNGPTSKRTVQHLHLSTADLEELRKKATENVVVINAESRRLDLGVAGIDASENSPAPEAADESPGEGDIVREEGAPGTEEDEAARGVDPVAMDSFRR